MSAYSLSVCYIVSMSLVTCQNGLLFLVYVSRFVVVVSFSTLAGNVLQLGEVAGFEALTFYLVLNFF
jgi:hypothetical protein